jgi:adenylosuccinate synthase
VTTGVTRYEELPGAAQRYVRALEDAVGAPAVILSTGPRREETIWRTDTPFVASLPPVADASPSAPAAR